MPLTGQAKTKYQREYMRNRRKKQVVRPFEKEPVRPELDAGPYWELSNLPDIDADGNPIPEY